MSTDPYPDVNGDDESGIVPPQSGRTPEWPKKIRTLTAAELDRLTIDSAGRFYWDGRLVNYEPPRSKEAERKPGETADRSAMELIERATYDLNEQQAPEPIEGAELPRTVDVHAYRNRLRTVEFDLERPGAAARGGATTAEPTTTVQTIRLPDRVRVSLSLWQSLALFIVLLGIVVGASGVAAYGWVVAHDWGCRIGLVKSYCPPEPAKPAVRPPRTDIPA